MPAITTAELAQRATAALKAARASKAALTWPEVEAIIAGALAHEADPGQSLPSGGLKYDRKRIPPPPEHVTAYSAEIGYPLDGQKWCDSYAQKGWAVGKTRMKDWQAAVRNWKSNGWGQNGIALNSTGAGRQQDYSRI